MGQVEPQIDKHTLVHKLLVIFRHFLLFPIFQQVHIYFVQSYDCLRQTSLA